MNLALLLLRVVIGGVFIVHGTQKLFGWFNGPGITGTATFLEQLRIRSPQRVAVALGTVEAIAGAGFAAGTITPLAASGLIGVMAAAIWIVHRPNGLFASDNGIEYPLTLATTVAAVALSGAGRYSIDRQAGWDFTDTRFGIAAIGVALIAATVVTATRRRPPKPDRGLNDPLEQIWSMPAHPTPAGPVPPPHAA